MFNQIYRYKISKSIILFFVLLSIILLPIFSCESDISLELINYYNKHLKGFLEQDTKAHIIFLSIVNNDFSNNKDLIESIDNKILPIYQKIVSKLGILKPSSDTIYAINKEYVIISQKRIKAYTILINALKNDDLKTIIAGFDILQHIYLQYKNWQTKLEYLADEYSLSFESSSD